MSRDARIATVAALLFVSAIGGALWYRGYPISLSALANIDRILTSGESGEAGRGSSPRQTLAQALPPPPIVESDDEPEEENEPEKEDEEAQADEPPKKEEAPPPPKKEEKKLAGPKKATPPAPPLVPTLPGDDFLSDVPLPPLDDEEPAPPKSAPKTPELPNEVASPPPAAPAKPPITAEVPLPTPALPADLETRDAPSAVIDQIKESVPNDLLPPAPPSVASEVEAPLSPSVIKAVPVPKHVEPEVAESFDEPEPEPIKPRVVASDRPPIPAPPGPTVARPTVPPMDPLSEPEPQPVPTPAHEEAEIIARAQPMTEKMETESVVGRSEPIARAAQPEASVASEPVAAPTAVAAEEEFAPIHPRGERYIPVGDEAALAQAREEFVPVAPLGPPTGLAFGETTVVSHVRKTSDTSEPNVVSYDATMYLSLEGDTYRTIAQTMYRSPEQAEALARYNRFQGSVSESVPVGTRVRIPPAEMLESMGKRANALASREGTRHLEKPNPPAAESKSPFDPRLPDVPVEPTAAASQGEYVANANETFWKIAQKTLGDGRRWREIYNINRDRVSNEINVPAGTKLRLPSGS